MAGKRITTELVVKAVDQYSGMIRNMSGVTGRFANKVRSEMGRLQGLRGPLRLIEDFRRQQQVVRSSGEAMEAARERVRQLQHAITTTRNPTAQMRREFERARTAAARLEDKHQQNRRTLHGLQGQLRSAGVNTGDLAGEQRRLTSALGAANTAFARQAERMQRLKVMQDRITAGRERMDRALARSANLSFVGNASMATGRRILTGMSSPIMQAVEFESAMSDVRKVVDFESPAAFRSMSDDILELSTRIPMAATGLAEIVAAGGQSGIAQDELARFAEMAAKIGVAFDISAGQSGESMASIKTAMALDLDQTGSLFDAMNHLSNNSAARADQTLEFLNRAGADGSNFGFDSTETLAIGAAMIAAGAGADTAATSFRNMGRALVRGEGATKRQNEAMSRLGLDSEGVARAMQEDAVGTTMDVMRRLNELPDHLRATVMSDLFGDEARELTKLLNNMQLMPEMLALVADESQYLGSAEAEYAERSKTTANNMQLLRNQVTRLGISIGEVVLPPLNDLLSKSQVFIDKMVTWTKEHPKLTKWLVISGVALGGMAVAGGALLTAAAGLIGTLAVLRFGLVGLGARAMFAGGGLANVAGRFGLLRRMPRLRLANLVTPLRWAAGLVPTIRWSSLAGRLRWSSLIRPLAWIGRGALRFIPVIGWAVLAGELAWHLLIKPLGWDKYLSLEALEGYLETVKSWFTWDNLAHVIDWAVYLPFAPLDSVLNLLFGFDWADKLPTWTWDFITEFDLSGLIKWPKPPDWLKWLMGTQEEASAAPLLREMPGFDAVDPSQASALETVELFSPAIYGANAHSLPTPAHLQELRDYAAALREEIAGIQGEIDNLGQGPMAASMAMPHQQTMDARKRELQEVEAELASSELMSGRLTTALQVLDGTEVAPEISTASIDRALEKVARLRAQLQAMPSAAAPNGAPVEVQERATGGPFGRKPLLVGERGPELYFPNRSGFIATNQQTQRLQRGAQRVRAAGMAALASSAVLASGSVAASPAGDGVTGRGERPNVTVNINGSINIPVPSGVTDPRAVAEIAADLLGERVEATFAASFSD